MQIQIIAMGNKMPNWVETGTAQYLVRMANLQKLNLIEIPLYKRSKNADIARIMMQEGELMLSRIKPGDLNITLEISGKNWSTEQLAEHINVWQNSAQNVNLLIGGPEGLADIVRAKSNTAWSLSNLTLPHPLVRIMVVEQIYRAFTILHNHPYHK